MSGPAWTTTYQCPVAGGYVAFKVVRVVAWPVPSATTWFRAKAIPPFWVQLPRWMCETCDELGGRLLMLSWMVTLPVPDEVTVMVPLAGVLTPVAAPIRKTLGVPCGLAEAVGVDWLGEGEPCAVPAPV